MLKKPNLAVIVPCLNEEEMIEKTHFELSSILSSLIENQKISEQSYICYIDDGSVDKTWKIIQELSKDDNVKGLKLSKNFGHQAALLAGLTQNEADIFVTIDADLQDDINLMPEMVNKYSEGYDIVYGVRSDRKTDNFFKKIFAQFYYKLIQNMGVKGVYNHADFRLVSKKITEVLSDLKEYNIYLRGLISNLGFKSCCVYYSRQKRVAGKAKYTFFSSLTLAVDGITSFSIVPLRLITFLGFLSFCIAVIMSMYSLFAYVEHKIVPGWASLFISLYFLGGIQLLSIGIIGEYIGKIYSETKQRPKFIIEDKVNG